MLTPQASASESLASQLNAMTWSKQYISTNPVVDFATDGGTSMIAAMDEFILTWLPSRGWTTAAQTMQPNMNDGLYRWWIDKDIQCIDNSYYSHRVVVYIQGMSTASMRFAYTRWDAGVAANTVFETYDLTGTTFDNQVYGSWEFWTSDQDSDSFLLVANGINTGVVAFMPPSGSIWPGTPEANGYYPVTNAPMIPCRGGAECWITSAGTSRTGLHSDLNNGSNHFYSQAGQVKVNFAAMQRGTSSSAGAAFLTSTNDCEMIVNLRQGTDQFDGVNTTLIDGDYFISLGQGSKLLLNTGTTDPQF